MLQWFKNMMGIIPKREQALMLEDEVTIVTKEDLQ